MVECFSDSNDIKVVTFVVRIQSKNSLADCNHLIRLGTPGDGGYVICSESVKNCNKLLSFGISDNWSFESGFLERNSLATIDCYDFSISFSVFLEKAAKSLVKFLTGRVPVKKLLINLVLPFKYYKFFRGNTKLFREKVTFPEFSAIDSNIEKIFGRIDSNHVYLKMDIEGSEYRVIPEILSRSGRICGMTIEFHDIYFLRDKFTDCLNLITEKFDIVHFHGNNFGFVSPDDGTPDVIEFSFVPKGSHKNIVNQLNTPIRDLDFPNNPFCSDYFFCLEEN